jgi:hypothetical protein
MRRGQVLAAGPRSRVAMDVLVAGWVMLWLAVGLLAAAEIRELRTLSDTVVRAGSALDQAGRAIEVLSVIPVVGEAPGDLGSRVRTAAAEVQTAGRSSRHSIYNLSLLLGFAIAVVPASPVLGFYLPMRVRRSREARAVARRLAGGGDPALEALLARRAVQYLPYHLLQRVSADPVGDLQAGSTPEHGPPTP